MIGQYFLRHVIIFHDIKQRKNMNNKQSHGILLYMPNKNSATK